MWFIFFVLVAMIAIVGVSQTLRAKEIVPWRTDFTAASEEARSADKPLFLYFTASWCGPCQRLRRTTWADADVERALRGYVPVKIDIDRQRDLAQQFAFTDAVPFFIVIDAQGRISKVLEGAPRATEFVDWLNAPSVLSAAIPPAATTQPGE